MIIGLGVVSLASLTSLVIVASIDGEDALATTALGLAIISFVVQVILFVVQQEASVRQRTRAEELHGRMIETLAQISERAASTQATVGQINDRLLDALLEKARRSGRTLDAETVRAATQTASGEGAGGERSGDPLRHPGKQPDPRDPEIVKFMTEWPSSTELDEILGVLEPMNDADLWRMGSHADDELRTRRPGATLDPGLLTLRGENDALVQRGWTELTGEEFLGSPLARLTDEGRELARVFTAEGPPPDGYSERVDSLRERVRDVDISIDG